MARDDALITEVYQTYYAGIEQYVRKNRGTAEDARDLFNDALKIIYLQGRDGLQLHTSFGGYLGTICRCRWINELKRRQRFTPDIEDQAEPVAEEDIWANMVAYERKLLYRKHFGQLPERCQQILTLTFEGLNYREVAERLDLNYSFVRRRAGECTKKLTQAIRQDPVFKELKGEQDA